MHDVPGSSILSEREPVLTKLRDFWPRFQASVSASKPTASVALRPNDGHMSPGHGTNAPAAISRV